MDKAKWLVTGAAGFLGSHVVEELLKKNQTVHGLDDLSWGKKEFLEPHLSQQNFHFHRQDIRDFKNLKPIVEEIQPDHIVHLAALHFIPLAIKEPALTIDINVRGTQSLLQALNDLPFSSFWFASTGDVYKTTTEPLVEDKTPLDPYNIYGLSKLMGEQLLRHGSQQRPDQCFIAGRLFNLIGPRETNPHIVPEIIKQLKADPHQLQLGNITPIRDYVPVDQAAKAVIDMCLQAQKGFFAANVATGVGQSVADLIQATSQLLGHEIQVHKDPSRVRAVDRPKLVAQVDRLKKTIGWAPSHRVQEILHELLQTEGLMTSVKKKAS